ncbi:unnamed protein product [Lactuca virosa]|uniref:Transposase-associated domain-containing protein n=1 Tax=Lactuca virosa TaxID=75947 RepID=A0AAU9MTC4_9ASTR|nr:unnamed protein product [Lactuca virosa]
MKKGFLSSTTGYQVGLPNLECRARVPVYAEVSQQSPSKSKCPSCSMRKDDVKLHLLQHGFTPNYTTWWAHGESTATFRHEVQPPNVMEDDELDGCTHMVMDAMGSIDNFKFNQEEQVPNPYAKGFYYMLHDADEPLWVGCQSYSKLQASSELLN